MSELPDRETFPEERAVADLLAENGRTLRRLGGRYSKSWPETRRAVTRPADEDDQFIGWPYLLLMGIGLTVWFLLVAAN